jgi:hypothetical protein
VAAAIGVAGVAVASPALVWVAAAMLLAAAFRGSGSLPVATTVAA